VRQINLISVLRAGSQSIFKKRPSDIQLMILNVINVDLDLYRNI